MGWTEVSGHTFIAPGVTLIHRFWWPSWELGPGRPVGHGPSVPGASDAWLMTELVGKHLICEIGAVTQSSQARSGRAHTGWDYK